MEIDFRIAAKAFIINDGKVLLIKRRSNDVHKPGEWDIPGGRLNMGEDPFVGVKREAHEEVGLAVEPVLPIAINHFTRDDGQAITMIIFGCRISDTAIKLSEEHTDYQWIDLDAAASHFPAWLRSIVAAYNTNIRPEIFKS
jgi:8-oxo-dGTP diphosphatase